MKLTRLRLLSPLLAWTLFACSTQSPEEHLVRQRIPVQIRKDTPVEFEIHSLSGNGVNDVGIRCSSEVWNAMTNGTKGIEVRLLSSNKKGTEIAGVDPTNSATGFLKYLTNVHYLFRIGGEHGARASVEIIFPNAPEGLTHAEIIVGKTPIDTKL